MKNIFVILSVCILISCKEYPVYPDIPSVEFKTAYISETESDYVIDFSFMLYDGDGNFGMLSSDTSTSIPDSLQQNFHATLYAKENGVFVKKPYNFNYRIPILRDTASDKFIKAEVSIQFLLAKTIFPYDTLFFTYYVHDRDYNPSNIDTSDIIILPKD